MEIETISMKGQSLFSGKKMRQFARKAKVYFGEVRVCVCVCVGGGGGLSAEFAQRVVNCLTLLPSGHLYGRRRHTSGLCQE